jgi:intracellular sulfur oxidation DsrE/DsrF family protein
MFRLDELSTHRRGFLGTLAAAAAAGMASLTPLGLAAQARGGEARGMDPTYRAWLNRITGRHKMLFDAPEVNSGFPVIWPRVWLNTTNQNYGTTDAQNTGVVVLRHSAIPLAMQDALWAKYKLGEAFSIKDGEVAATRNLFAKPLPLPIADTGVELLLAKGVLVGVCDIALTVYSSGVAQKMGMDAAAVKADWIAGLLPGIQIVPSGVLAVADAQERGCGYCFAG